MHLQKTRVSCICVVIEDLDLSVQLHEGLLLVPILPFDLLTQLVLFVQGSVFVLDDVHLKYSACGVFFSLDNLDLPAMILDLTDDVDQDLLKAFKLATEGHLLLALQSEHGLRARVCR